jgi:hypothetical protein
MTFNTAVDTIICDLNAATKCVALRKGEKWIFFICHVFCHRPIAVPSNADWHTLLEVASFVPMVISFKGLITMGGCHNLSNFNRFWSGRSGKLKHVISSYFMFTNTLLIRQVTFRGVGSHISPKKYVVKRLVSSNFVGWKDFPQP